MKASARILWSALAWLAMALPLVWAFISSFLPGAALFSPAEILQDLTVEHYRVLFSERDFTRPIRSSLVVSLAATALCLAVGTAAGYALGRLRFTGRRAVLGVILSVSMFPQIAVVAPLYSALRAFGLIDTYTGLVLTYLAFAMPLCIWLLASTFSQLPPELEQAARIDGAGRFQALWHIVLPNALPGIVAAGIVTFVYCYSEFLFALSFTTGPRRQTVPVAIALLRGRYQVPWGEILAGAVVATIPVVALALVLGGRLAEGLATGSRARRG